VLAWLAREGSIALASVTVYELARGVERKPSAAARLEGKSRGLGVASRNVAHFRGFGVAVDDPFADAHA